MTDRNKFKSLNSIVVEKCINRRLPFERRTKLRPLGDTLLELCARNFGEIFVEADGKNTETLKKGVKLESNLFERILEKGREIYLIMPPQQVKLLLGFRKELNWQNIDLYKMYRGSLDLTEIDLEIISRCKVPVKKLLFHSNNQITDAMLYYISTFSATLEHLQIEAEYCSVRVRKQVDGELAEAMKSLYLSKIKLPNLRYLKLSFNNVPHSLSRVLDISSFAGTMRVLKLHDYKKLGNENSDSALLFELIGSCKDLQTLSLKKLHLDENEVDHLLASIGSLRNLRTLDMQFAGSPLTPDHGTKLDLSRTVASLPKLRNLEASSSVVTLRELNSAEVKLNYLGAVHIRDEAVLTVPADNLINDRSFETYDSLLRCFEISETDSLCFEAILKLSAFIANDSPEAPTDFRLNKVEGALLKIVAASLSYLPRIVTLAQRPTLRHRLSPGFWADLTRSYVCSQVHFSKRSSSSRF